MAWRPALRADFGFGTLTSVLMRAFVRRLVLAVWAFLCAAILTTSLWPATEWVRTEDQNHDGRPDIWRFYDRQGRLARVEIDTNFDGRSDHRDYYRDGVLTRSESDRNFDNRIDLIEEFDRSGLQHVRSVVDANFDGAADLLVLFQDGQPVHSEWATPARVRTASPRSTSTEASDDAWRFAQPAGDAVEPLTPLDDPFSASASIRASHRPRAADSAIIGAAGVTLDVPTSSPMLIASVDSGRLTLTLSQHPPSLALLAWSGRAPPPSLLG